MTIKTTLSFTDRHHRYLTEKVGEGVYASASSAVAAAIEQMMQDEVARGEALEAMTAEIRARMGTPTDRFVDEDTAFGAARDIVGR